MATVPETFVVDALRWDTAGYPRHAVQLLATAVEQHPTDAMLRMRYADCRARCGRASGAAQEYLRAALQCSDQQRDEEALALLFRVLDLDARYLVQVVLANMVRRMGPDARHLCGAAAKAHLDAGRLIDGLHMLRLGVEIDPDNVELRRKLAAIYRVKGMKRDAVEQLTEVGRLLIEADQHAQYITVAEQLLSLDPWHLEARRAICRAHLMLHQPQEAVMRLGQLMQLSPGDVVGCELLAQAHARLGRRVTSLLVLERLANELRSTFRTAMADALLLRARDWLADDPHFRFAVQRMHEAGQPPRHEHIQSTEHTVALELADLIEVEERDETMPILLDDIIEIHEAPASIVANSRPTTTATSTQITIRYVAWAG